METFVLQDKITARMTDEEFLQFCLGNPNLRIERDGNLQIIIMSPVTSQFSSFNAEVSRQLGNWNQNQEQGIVFDSSAGFTLPDRSVRSPDAAWISKEKWNKLSSQEKKGFALVCPEFVIEVRSESDHLEDQKEKMKNVWIKNGAQLAWLIDPIEKISYIYKPDGSVEKIEGFDKTLKGEEPVKDFNLDLSLMNLEG